MNTQPRVKGSPELASQIADVFYDINLEREFGPVHAECIGWLCSAWSDKPEPHDVPAYAVRNVLHLLRRHECPSLYSTLEAMLDPSEGD